MFCQRAVSGHGGDERYLLLAKGNNLCRLHLRRRSSLFSHDKDGGWGGGLAALNEESDAQSKGLAGGERGAGTDAASDERRSGAVGFPLMARR